MRSISQAKPQVKLQINIQKQKNLQLTRGLSCPPKDDPLNEKSGCKNLKTSSNTFLFIFFQNWIPKPFFLKKSNFYMKLQLPRKSLQKNIRSQAIWERQNYFFGQKLIFEVKGAQGEVFKLKETKSGEFFAGKFYFSNDPELIVQVQILKLNSIKFYKNYR